MFKIKQDNPYYQKAIWHESAQWGSSTHEPNVHQNYDDQPMFQSYYNEAVTGKADKDWKEFIMEKWGPFKRGAILGCGLGGTEEKFVTMNSIGSFDLYDVSAGALEKLRKRMIEQVLVRCRFQVSDLNFMEFAQESYDFILCNSILHHCVNLEHLLFQIRKALTPDGIFVVRDFVGETRFQ